MTHLILLGPPGIQILLREPLGVVLPLLGHLVLLDVFVLFTPIPLPGHGHDSGINDLSTLCCQTVLVKVGIKPLEELFGNARLSQPFSK